MEIKDLDEWKTYCLRAATRSVDRDREVLSSGWGSGTITPPPALEDPNARIPLERAEELRRLADREAGEEGREHLERAIAWLEHPHPRISRDLRGAMRRARANLRARLGAMESGCG